MIRLSAMAIASICIATILMGTPSCDASILSNVELGGWEETEPGGGNWDDQNSSGPFPNIVAALTGASLPAAGLVKVAKIEDPTTTGSGLGVSFDITGQGTNSGTWILNQGDLNLAGGKVLAYFSLKAAQSWNLWQIMSDIDLRASTYTNAWDTNSSGGGLLTPNGKSFAGLSHITFWAIDDTVSPPPPVVPEPVSAAVWSLLMAFAGIAKSRGGR